MVLDDVAVAPKKFLGLSKKPPAPKLVRAQACEGQRLRGLRSEGTQRDGLAVAPSRRKGEGV